MEVMEEVVELIRKGSAFEILLQSPVYRDAMKEARERLHQQIEESAEEDVEARENIYKLIRVLMVVNATASSVVSEGIAAEQYREQMEGDNDE